MFFFFASAVLVLSECCLLACLLARQPATLPALLYSLLSALPPRTVIGMGPLNLMAPFTTPHHASHSCNHPTHPCAICKYGGGS
ncbi:hypothetical protein F4778DRAFT_572956 [Xylariomycetidae sp. FL2044]|nr:hypothetical protein F4778DRAFT_572956 [Xylariomycetidae sp. FL2044]